jgi:hypothetical protein
MSDDLSEQLQRLQQAIVDLDKACKRMLGFTGAIDYMGISFNVSRRYVIADLTPIAYLGLVEYTDEGGYEAAADGAQEAVVRLYDRLLPLLLCVHQWTALTRAEDLFLRSTTVESSGNPHICKLCTAYALEGSLPLVGRISVMPVE